MGRCAGKPHKDGIMHAIESLAIRHEAGTLNDLTLDRAYEFVTAALRRAGDEAAADMHYAQDVQERFEESASPDYLASDEGRREQRQISEAVERAVAEVNHLHVAVTLCYASEKRYTNN